MLKTVERTLSLHRVKTYSLVALYFVNAFAGCTITAVRPAQEMSNMEVALRAAKEVNADVLAPELYRMGLESGMAARREYRFKNFFQAKQSADQARNFAERAEFEAIRNGGKREAIPQDPLAEPSYPEQPTGTPNPDAKTNTTAPSNGTKK